MSVTTVVTLDLAGSGAFATVISPYLISATIRQGRTKSLDAMQPGTATVVLDNADGRFSPKYTGGPYGATFNNKYIGIRIAAGTRYFVGYIDRIEQNPYLETREVTLQCIDRLGLMARQQVSAGPFRKQAVSLVLNRLLDLLETGEEITNPGCEGGVTTGWSAAAAGGTAFDVTDSNSFEGDYCARAICDGSATAQGVRYDLGADLMGLAPRNIALAVRTTPGDGDVSLTLRCLNAALTVMWSDTIAVIESGWTYIRPAVDLQRRSYRYIEVITQAAVPLTILVDCLHQIQALYRIDRSIPTTLDAVVELLALYNAPALESLTKVAATEGGGFLYMQHGGVACYGTIYVSAAVVRATKTVPSATFGDDGVNVMFCGLNLVEDANELVSRVELSSDGDFTAGTEEEIVWDLAPAPLLVPASAIVKLEAEYSALARKCRVELGTATSEQFKIAAAGDDEGLRKIGATWPPGTTEIESLGFVGQHKSGVPYYYIRRAFLRRDTSGIGAGSTVAAAKLRILLTARFRVQAWTLEVRQPAAYDWSPIDTGDWRADPASDTLIGSMASADFPAVGEWLEIDLDPTAITKDGITAFYLISNRDTTPTEPATNVPEYLVFSQHPTSPAELWVEHNNISTIANTFKSYGAGGDIELTAGADPVLVPAVTVYGYPFSRGSDRSVIVGEAVAPLNVVTNLSVQMPYQGTRTPDMVAENARLLARWGDTVDQFPLALRDEDAASLAQMQARQIDDLIHVHNTKWAHDTQIDGDYFIEGITWTVTDQGKVLEVELDVEAE